MYMNLRKLTDFELEKLINHSKDINIILKAEEEFVRRHNDADMYEITEDDIDTDVMDQIDGAF